jgi:hypothetical protein
MYVIKETCPLNEMYAIKESYTIQEMYAVKARFAVSCDSWHKFLSDNNSVTVNTGTLLYRLELLPALVPRVWAFDSVGCIHTISRPTGSDIS